MPDYTEREGGVRYDGEDIQAVRDLIILNCQHDPEWKSRGAKALRTINALVDALEGALGHVEALTSQFDHAGCMCTFPDDDCCAFAKADALVANGRSLIFAAKEGAA